MESSITVLNEDYKKKFRTLYLEGKTIKEANEILQFNQNTFDSYYYDNKHGLREYMLAIKREKMLIEAERVSSEIMSLNAGENAKLLSIKQKEAEFLRETQGKDLGYSKRIETIGLNINKNEPLDDDQKAKLDKFLKSTGNKATKEAEVIEVEQDMAQ